MVKKISAFDIKIDPVTMDQAVKLISSWISERENLPCRYVVTPNVDHIVCLKRNKQFYQSYKGASMVLIDGKPVWFGLKLLGKPVPEVVPGSDLVPNIFSQWNNQQKELKVFLLGAAPGVAKKAAGEIAKRWPYITIVGLYAPPQGFETDVSENQAIITKINRCQPDLIIIGLGAPKQEIWINNHRKELKAAVAICAGATIDFLAGEQIRSPIWMQKLALEWLHRISQNPKRLIWRYVYDALMFPPIIWREWRK